MFNVEETRGPLAAVLTRCPGVVRSRVKGPVLEDDRIDVSKERHDMGILDGRLAWMCTVIPILKTGPQTLRLVTIDQVHALKDDNEVSIKYGLEF